MKKENYGIPTALLSVVIYLAGLYAAASAGSLWVVLGITVLVFALQFNSNVKKVAIQALGLAAAFAMVGVAFDVIDLIINIIDEARDAMTDPNGGFMTFLDILKRLVEVARYVVFGTLVITSLLKREIIIDKVHMIVDGFVPVKQVQQSMYNGMQQPFNGQPQQQFAPNGQPQQQFAPNGQPRQPFNGQPQQFNGQSQPFNVNNK